MSAFDRIALSLSGGGYRAAGFHLGVLLFLETVGILRNVRALSTASGGTIAGAFYAQCLADGTPFSSFVERFYRFLRDVDVIDGALEKMPPRSDPRGAKLIVAAADLYSRALFPSLLGDVQRSKDHLEEITFNATDMTRGLAFRFVKTTSRFVRTGNRHFNIPDEMAARIRLADVVAASSCFPAAFEPMTFPTDFVLNHESPAEAGATYEEARGAGFSRRTIPLMDGGIYDNQGIAGLLLVRARRSKEIDTILISDADRAMDSLYDEPGEARRGFVRVWMVIVAIILFAIAAIASSVELFRTGMPVSLGVSVIAAVVSIVALFLIALAVRLPIPSRPRPVLWRHVLKLSVSELLGALRLRASSLVALTARVFMKRVRSLTYEGIFESFSGGRAIGNLITDLPKSGEGTAAMREVAARAAAMPTVLWFEDEKQLRELIATGQMTTCFNLLRRLERAEDRRDELSARLFESCTAAWDRYQRDPLADVPTRNSVQ